MSSITDYKFFWKNVCSLFSEKKVYKSLIITLLEKGKIATDHNKNC